MANIRIHYTNLLHQITYFLFKHINRSQITDFDNSESFNSLRNSYYFDMENSDTIDLLIEILSRDDDTDLTVYNEEFVSAVMIRIIILNGIFNAEYITPYLTVPEDMRETIPLILIDLWKVCRVFVEAELEIS